MKKKSGSPRWLWLSGGILILGIAGYFIGRELIVKEKDKPSAVSSVQNPGSVRPCAVNPVFPIQKGLRPPFLIDLRQQGYRGLRIIENRVDGNILELPGWDAFGWLGLYSLDDMGNIYLSSVPHESIQHNPVGEQNRILVVDSQTGIMSEFMSLPQEKPSTLKNPFGAMGLHYDCDNKFLYVSSIAGSTIDQSLGSVFQIDLQKKKVVDRLKKTDAIGLSTFNNVGGKRLYFGLAREPEVYSIALDDNGRFTGKPRKEFSLLDQPGGAFDKAHRIRFRGDQMEVKANEFTYTLAAASDPHRNIYNFKYNRNTDQWEFINMYQQQQ